MKVALYLLALILVIPTLLRFLLSLFRALLAPARPASSDSRSRSADIPLRGELKRDPVCGTYVSTATSLKKTINGEVIHFCSEECRAKHT